MFGHQPITTVPSINHTTQLFSICGYVRKHVPISQSNNRHNLKQERITPLLLPTFTHLFTLSAKSPTCDYPDTDLHLILRGFLSNAQRMSVKFQIFHRRKKEKYLLK